MKTIYLNTYTYKHTVIHKFIHIRENGKRGKNTNSCAGSAFRVANR